jgi:hypothetical protein
VPNHTPVRHSRRLVALGKSPWACAAALSLAFSLTASLAAQEAAGSAGSDTTWRFAVSGDSRNCGDIVMPAIAQGVRQDGASFYWHLGDYRAIYMFDEDYQQLHPATNIADYQANAWPDFIAHQLKPFGDLPVFLALGNHELVPPKSRAESALQFADWLGTPLLQKQRLADNPDDHLLKTYYHWIDRGIDFINLDNASPDEFDAVQLNWLTAVLKRAAGNVAVKTVVVGAHAALPDSLSAGHSMNESAQEQATGRRAYTTLVDFQRTTGKRVYVLASHSHYVMNNIYATACHGKDELLRGWIVGTAGAVRYRLPQDHAAADLALTDVYGYVLGTVSPDGSIRFEFKAVNERDVPAAVVEEFSGDKVHWCFAENKSSYVVAGPSCGSAPATALAH